MKMIVHIETNFGHIHVECDTLTQCEALTRLAERTAREIEFTHQYLLVPQDDADQDDDLDFLAET